MKKFISIASIFALILCLCACGNGGTSNDVSREEYDALLAENEQLKQQLAQYEGTSGNQNMNIPHVNQDVGNSAPAATSDFIYVNNGSEVQINGYKGNGGYVVIPSEIDGSVVTRIAPNAFEAAESITGITLPEKLQYIGDNAFYGLKKLTGVLVIPETVTVIEGHAFQSTRLTGLVIKSSCEISINTFANINTLEFIYVQEGCAPEIGTSAFSYAEALKTAVFPDTMSEIKDETFKACNNMVIYTTPGSYAEAYAKRNFISVNTESYAEQVEIFSKDNKSNLESDIQSGDEALEETDKTVEEERAEADNYDESKDTESEIGVVEYIHTTADIPNELMNDEFKSVIDLFSKGFSQSGLDIANATTYDDGETYIFYLDNLEFVGDKCEDGVFQPRVIYSEDAINNNGSPYGVFFEIANPLKSNGYKETVEMVEDIAEALDISDEGLIDNNYSSSSKLAIGEYATFTFPNLDLKLTVSNTDGTIEIEIVPVD